MDPLSIARYGMMTAENRVAAAAGAIADWTAGGVDLVQQDADLLEAQQQFAATAKVASFANDMWRALLEMQKSA